MSTEDTVFGMVVGAVLLIVAVFVAGAVFTCGYRAGHETCPKVGATPNGGQR